MTRNGKHNGHGGDGHKTATPDVSHIRNEEVTHERSDVSVQGVVVFCVVLGISIAVVSLGVWFMFNYFNAQEAKEPQPGPMALTKGERLPPEPRLQTAPGFGAKLDNGEVVPLEKGAPQAEYRVLREQWDKELHGELKDKSGNPVGMPIDQAMKQIVSGGALPARTQTAPGKLQDYAVSLPTAASSGRETMKRLQ
jgi:hypothetical protein